VCGRVDAESGEMRTIGRVAAGLYDIRVNVHDSVWDLSVQSTVTIDIKHISRQAVLNSGSLRLHGPFIRPFHLLWMDLS